MINTIYAIKQQNTQTWDKNGKRMPVTVAKLPHHTVLQVKQAEDNGYSALQVGFGDKKVARSNKPVQGHVKKAGIEGKAYQFIKEIRLDEKNEDVQLKPGENLSLQEIVKVGDILNVSTNSKGTGFTGVMKRWGFKGGPRTHGQSDRERAPGSIGQGTTPGRVWKGKKMAGRDGGLQVTQQNLQIVKLDLENQEVWIKGTTPGHTNSLLTLKITGHKDFVGLSGETNTEAEENAETQEVASDGNKS